MRGALARDCRPRALHMSQVVSGGVSLVLKFFACVCCSSINKETENACFFYRGKRWFEL
jgi:hypothetical protein